MGVKVSEMRDAMVVGGFFGTAAAVAWYTVKAVGGFLVGTLATLIVGKVL